MAAVRTLDGAQHHGKGNFPQARWNLDSQFRSVALDFSWSEDYINSLNTLVVWFFEERCRCE